MAGSYTVVRKMGPLFDGEASVAVREWIDASLRETSETGADWIRIAAMGMDKSGRGGTGHAAAAVHVTRLGPVEGYRIWGGMVKGEVWWPWLEGVSRRNVRSKFKGYLAFRTARYKLQRYEKPVFEARLAEFIGRMGGEIV
jgi:hypothetical protein